MTSPTNFKREIKAAILAAVARDGRAVLDVLVASLELETGFKRETILNIIKNMELVGLINIKDGIISAGTFPERAASPSQASPKPDNSGGE